MKAALVDLTGKVFLYVDVEDDCLAYIIPVASVLTLSSTDPATLLHTKHTERRFLRSCTHIGRIRLYHEQEPIALTKGL